MELIFTRYCYALGFLKSCSGHINELRKAKVEKNVVRSGEILKVVMERLSNAAIRILKLKDQEKLIFVIFKRFYFVPCGNKNLTIFSLD
jgi:hypothetical protein